MKEVKDWGESASDLMIVKKKKKERVTRDCTQYCLAWTFYLLYMLYSNLSWLLYS